MSEMVERVARAISPKTWDDPVCGGLAKEAARAAIEAMREPTEAMMKAGEACDEMWDEFTATPKHAASCEVHWQAMITAALSDTEGAIDG